MEGGKKTSEIIKMIFKKKPTGISTSSKITWCPGCFNNQILAGVKKALQRKNLNEFALVTGIGCHGKMYDYLNINGINALHGRVLPTCLGIKIGNPNLNVLGFAGDGDAYAEGISHLIHVARYNIDVKYFVHNNQVFALTVGQPTPTTEIGFKDKTNPLGVKIHPLNPLKLALSSGATFVARVFADAKQIEWVTKEALKHKGFAFIEILQPCLIFHPDVGYKEKTYWLDEKGHDKVSFDKAWKKAGEFDYNTVKKIPLGIFYQIEKETFVDKWPQLTALKKKNKSWKDISR